MSPLAPLRTGLNSGGYARRLPGTPSRAAGLLTALFVLLVIGGITAGIVFAIHTEHLNAGLAALGSLAAFALLLWRAENGVLLVIMTMPLMDMFVLPLMGQYQGKRLGGLSGHRHVHPAASVRSYSSVGERAGQVGRVVVHRGRNRLYSGNVHQAGKHARGRGGERPEFSLPSHLDAGYLGGLQPDALCDGVPHPADRRSSAECHRRSALDQRCGRGLRPQWAPLLDWRRIPGAGNVLRAVVLRRVADPVLPLRSA